MNEGKTQMSPYFPQIPKGGIIAISTSKGTKQYVTKEGMYSLAFTVGQKMPYRIEYDLCEREIDGHRVLMCKGRLYKTELSQEKSAAMNLLMNENVLKNAPLVDMLMSILEKPDCEDIAVKPMPIAPKGTVVDPKEIEALYKRTITNCKMRVLSEFVGAGYAIVSDMTDEDVEDASPERQMAAVEEGLKKFEEMDKKEVALETKADYIRAISEICIRNLGSNDIKVAYFKDKEITRNSQLTDDQAKELYEQITKSIGLLCSATEETATEE